jgi:similar to stage IV sporulation protein
VFIIRWWRYLRGFVVVTLEGRGVERLLNLAVMRGLGFWDLRREKGIARLSLSVSAFRALRPLVRQARCRLRIRKKVGLPFIKLRLRRRWGLAAGAVLFVAVLYLATAMIWQVRVVGLNQLKEGEILELVEQLGIRRGTWKRGLDLSALAEELPRRNSAIAWAGMRLRGILLEVEIVEHLTGTEMDDRPADLVATRDGLIERVVVIEGRAAVQAGDTVSRGDLLIEGIKSLEEGILEPDDQPPPEEVRARGKVEARVWYEAKEPIRLTGISAALTGRSSSAYFLCLRGGERLLWGPRENPYEGARQKSRHFRWGWRNLYLPVEVRINTFYEMRVERQAVPYDEALRLAREKAEEKLLKTAPGKKSWEQLYFEEYKEKKARWVRAVVETREDIGMVKLRRP